MSNVRSLQSLIRVTPRVNTSASCHSSRVLPHAPLQLMPPEVTASQSVEVLCVNTSALLIRFAQQGPVHGAFAHMAGSSSSQFMKGASRRRAAPGSRPVEVAARAATCPASNEVVFAREGPGSTAPYVVRFHLPVYSEHPTVPGSEGMRFAPALRRCSAYAHGEPPQALARNAHACPALGTLWRANKRRRPGAFIKSQWSAKETS